MIKMYIGCHVTYALFGFPVPIFTKYSCIKGGTRWNSWLRHCATNRKVAGSIPDGVIGIFH